MKKLKNDEATDQEDYFGRLPEELLISIFTKLADLKFLCQCSLVCKRFASIMSHVSNVSLTLPNSEAVSLQSTQNECMLFQEILRISSEEIPGFIQSLSIQKLNFTKFLQKFRKLESIYLEFACPRNISNSPFLKWKAKCGSSRIELESLVSLLPAAVHKKIESQLDEEQENQEMSRGFIRSQLNNWVKLSFMRCAEWVHILCILIKCHHSLKSVTITNSEKQGKLVLKDEQLITWRNGLLNQDPSLLNGHRLGCEFPNFVKIAMLRVLNLPLSGYLMKGVFLVIIKFSAELHANDVGKEDIMTWDYEEEEKVLGEAVKEILMNHKDQIFELDLE
ncbi:Uncharacterized protein Adt_46884 [Abeliophyllum distichum]|uniref:F-box domain-containing protein n=1 Tax=Abeliophyllum distichum TaxID=126358 RepID=A0ABD1NX93_9LAMI